MYYDCVTLLDCQVLQVLHVVEKPAVELHVMTVLKIERHCLSWRLTGVLDSVLHANLEDLLVMTVAMNGDAGALTTINFTQ